MKVMVFLQGTAIMHKSALSRTREDRIKQVLDGDPSIVDFASYVPVGEVVQKLQAWRREGAEIIYLSSHRKTEDVEVDRSVLRKYGFPEGQIFYRRAGEQYSDVAENVRPDILVEDDCTSIGGRHEMTYPHLRPEVKAEVKSIVVGEFGGLDHLPDDISALMTR
jgi:hypothetical protein